MPSIAQALVQAATNEVQAGGLHWRIRRIATADLVEAGGAFVLATRRVGSPEELTKSVEADPAKMRDGFRFLDAVVAAGVISASQDGQTWEELRVVLDPRQESPGSNRVHVSSLPPGAVQVLANAILDLSNAGGAAGERLASFLGGGAAPPRRPRR